MLFYLQWFAVTWHPWLRTNWSNCPQTDGRFPGKRIFSVCRQFLQSCKACHASFKAENIHLWNSPWWSQGKFQRYCKKKKLKKADSVWKRSDHVVCQWNDKGNMLTISNKHSVEIVPVPNKRGQLTIKPNIVCDYNNDISGVDRFDQMLTYYQGLRKCIQWYKKMELIFLIYSFIINFT